jgi:hypothetical protein
MDGEKESSQKFLVTDGSFCNCGQEWLGLFFSGLVTRPVGIANGPLARTFVLLTFLAVPECGHECLNEYALIENCRLEGAVGMNMRSAVELI